MFEVKMDIDNQYSRLIYAVFYPHRNEIFIFGMFDRDKEFKEFERIFKRELKKLKK